MKHNPSRSWQYNYLEVLILTAREAVFILAMCVGCLFNGFCLGKSLIIVYILL